VLYYLPGQGEGDQEGIIPRLCKDLFVRIDKDDDSEFSVEVLSFFFFLPLRIAMH
jgi:hypothetical protein